MICCIQSVYRCYANITGISIKSVWNITFSFEIQHRTKSTKRKGNENSAVCFADNMLTNCLETYFPLKTDFFPLKDGLDPSYLIGNDIDSHDKYTAESCTFIAFNTVQHVVMTVLLNHLP